MLMEEEEEEGTGVSCSWSRGDVPSPTPGVELSGGLGKVSTIVSLDTLKLFLDPRDIERSRTMLQKYKENCIDGV
jgi:hypothetical protein